MDENGFVVIADFGLSEILVDGKSATFAGSLEYMAPEVLEEKEYGVEIDIWSLGILAYELVYGNSPFARPTE
jgi:serine/threonine protein kinase